MKDEGENYRTSRAIENIKTSPARGYFFFPEAETDESK